MFPISVSCVSFLLLASYAVSSDLSEEESYETDSSDERILGMFLFDGHEACEAEAKESWSYRGENSPIYWGDSYPACNGKEQSPINITSQEAVHDPSLEKLFMNNYNISVTNATIENNGHTVQVTPTDGVDRTIFVNGSTYKLLQMHFHWGDYSNHGAEHTVNGTQYALELHLVHQNVNNELAVVGVFYQEQQGENTELQNIIRSFPKVMFKGTETELESNLNLNNLLPANPSSFYRYAGSLTTPGCTEGVTWSVLTEPLPVGDQQMAEFRQLYSVTEDDANPACTQSNNYRPVQPINNRKVYISQ